MLEGELKSEYADDPVDSITLSLPIRLNAPNNAGNAYIKDTMIRDARKARLLV
jgi:hypothetical protein